LSQTRFDLQAACIISRDIRFSFKLVSDASASSGKKSIGERFNASTETNLPADRFDEALWEGPADHPFLF
jgi:hypothetical protein